jgi:hypothetical protein
VYGAAREVLTVGLSRSLMLVGVKTVLFHITRKYQIIRAVCNERVLCAIAFRTGSSNSLFVRKSCAFASVAFPAGLIYLELDNNNSYV